jgi:pentatricopeptide repeat protein
LPDIVSFNSVIRAYTNVGNIRDALSILEAVTVAPTIHTFKPIIALALEAHQPDFAIEIWSRAMQARATPDTEAFNLCLSALVVRPF